MVRNTRMLDEQEVADRERAADRALYAVDPELACALGYVAQRTRAGSLRNPTANAVRAMPQVPAQTLTVRPHDSIARLVSPRRFVGPALPFLPLG
jgi:hypothetical protein